MINPGIPFHIAVCFVWVTLIVEWSAWDDCLLCVTSELIRLTQPTEMNCYLLAIFSLSEHIWTVVGSNGTNSNNIFCMFVCLYEIKVKEIKTARPSKTYRKVHSLSDFSKVKWRMMSNLLWKRWLNQSICEINAWVTPLTLAISFDINIERKRVTLSSKGVSRAAARMGPLRHFQTSFTEAMSSKSRCSYRALKMVYNGLQWLQWY